jgi:Ca2+-binding RTX toxin-like protein
MATLTDAQIQATNTLVSSFYVSMFNRAPERDGLAYWSNEINSGKSPALVAQSMFSVSAARNIYPSNMSNTDIVSTMYQNTLGRAADPAGLQYWTGRLDAGATKGQVFNDFATAVLNYTGTDPVGLSSQALFSAKVGLSTNYSALMGGNDVAAAAAVYSVVTSTAGTTNGSVADDTYTLANGNFAVNGGGGNDTITTGVGNSAVTTLSGNDTITTGAGNSYVNAGNGNNTITTGVGSNSVFSGSGLDTITTGAGNDTIQSGAGADTITAAGGNDVIVAGGGADQISGGPGRDVFMLASTSDSTVGAVDMISDFGKVTIAVTPVENSPMVDMTSFQASSTGKGGIDADLLRFATKATLGGTQLAAGSAVDSAYSGMQINITESANGRLTITGTDAATVGTLVKWTAVADYMAAAVGDVVEFEFGGNTYVFQQGGATDALVQLSSVGGITGIVIIGTTTAASAGDIFVV